MEWVLTRFSNVPIGERFAYFPSEAVAVYVKTSDGGCRPEGSPNAPEMPMKGAVHVYMLVERFVLEYLETALQLSHSFSEEKVDEDDLLSLGYDASDMSAQAWTEVLRDVRDFFAKHGELIESAYEGPSRYTAQEYAASDFHLTRNHHGAGFWDGGWEAEAGRTLTEASHVYGESELMVGDDGLIYHYPG